MNKRTKYTITIVVSVLLVLITGVAIYLGNYYRADEKAMSAMVGTDTVSVYTEGQYTVFKPSNAKTGFIFYPGGKVEHTAYALMLNELAESGILCVLAEMPGNLAVLDSNAAEGISERFPKIENWYIGGHSLGGSMAASYADGHDDEIDGLVLLAAYSTADLNDNDLSVISIYGTQDGVMNKEKYEQYGSNLPQATEEIIIDGGNHAGFGNYGAQDGDGMATISSEEQQMITVNSLIEFFEKASI